MILEGRADLGGTWDLFRYPGVRSDSDMHTLGYEFKPWTDEKSIADGPSILAYLRETAAENHVDAHIRYHHQVQGASWSSDDARWTVHAEDTANGARVELTCSFLFMNAGYYSYKEPYAAETPGHRPLPRHGRASAVLAGRSRLPRQARRGDRLGGDGDDDRAGDGRGRPLT